MITKEKLRAHSFSAFDSGCHRAPMIIVLRLILVRLCLPSRGIIDYMGKLSRCSRMKMSTKTIMAWLEKGLEFIVDYTLSRKADATTFPGSRAFARSK